MLRSLFALSLSFAFVPVAMADAPPTDTPIQLAKFNDSSAGTCLQTPSNLPLAGDRVHQAQCQTVGEAQMYVFETAALGYRVRSAQSVNCLDSETGADPGDPVRLLACSAAANQQWTVQYTPGNPNVAVIRNVQTGMCLDVADGFATVSSCGAAGSATWLVNPQPSRLPGTALNLRSTFNDRCMSLAGLPTAVTCTDDGTTSLRMLPVDNAAATFRFMGTTEDTCLLEVDGVATYDLCITGPTAHWRLLEHSMSTLPISGEKTAVWQVQSVNSGQCLNVQRNGIEDETVSLWPCDTVANSLWRFTRY